MYKIPNPSSGSVCLTSSSEVHWSWGRMFFFMERSRALFSRKSLRSFSSRGSLRIASATTGFSSMYRSSLRKPSCKIHRLHICTCIEQGWRKTSLLQNKFRNAWMLISEAWNLSNKLILNSSYLILNLLLTAWMTMEKPKQQIFYQRNAYFIGIATVTFL